MNNNGAQLTFGLETLDTADQEIVLREATVVLTLQSLKVLKLVLDNAVDFAERQFGRIQLAPGKEEELKSTSVLAATAPVSSRT